MWFHFECDDIDDSGTKQNIIIDYIYASTFFFPHLRPWWIQDDLFEQVFCQCWDYYRGAAFFSMLFIFFHFFDLFCFHCATTSAIWNFISFCAITRFCDLIYSNELMFNGLTHGSTCFYIHIFDDEFENYFPTKQPISDAHNLAFDIEKLHLRLLFGSFWLHSNVCLFLVPCHSKCVRVCACWSQQ